ncbi:uncharacterized protein [Hetaerina americana]|uniref:uncharacterized protein n=1 Tax=Hetaerina americana TaxID=62018 RepID=UPI003A7F13F2
MKTLALCFVAALVGCVYAEPPSGYSYNRPSGGHIGGGGYSHSGGGGFISSGGGFQTQEGLSVDPAVLEQVRQILERNEVSSQHTASIASIPSSSYGVPSGQYGAPARIPSSSYGAPSY